MRRYVKSDHRPSESENNRILFDDCTIFERTHWLLIESSIITWIWKSLNVFSSQRKLIKIWNGVWKMPHLEYDTKHSYLVHIVTHNKYPEDWRQRNVKRARAHLTMYQSIEGPEKKERKKTTTRKLFRWACACVELSLRSVVIIHILSNLKR